MKKRGNGEGCIRQLPNGYWEARIMIGYTNEGKKRYKTFSRKQRTEVAKLLSDYIANQKDQEPEVIYNDTLAKWVNQWYQEYVIHNVKVSTRESYEGIIKHHLIPRIGHIKLKDLKKAHIEAMYRALIKNGKRNGKGGLSVKTVKNISVVLHKALDEAMKREIIIKNPATIATVPTMRSENRLKKEIEVLSKEEQQRLMTACGNDVYSIATLTILHTGVRLGELLGIQWNDIDFKTKTISINKQVGRYKNYGSDIKSKTILGMRHDTKTKTSTRKISISDVLLKRLMTYRKVQQAEILRLGREYKKQGTVFARYDGNFIDPSTFRYKYRDILRKAGLKEYNVHALRHTFATRALEAEIPIKVVSEILGHASVQITMDTYSHVLPDLQNEAMNRIADYYNRMA